MKQLVLDKTCKDDVEHYRKKIQRYKNSGRDEKMIKAVFKNIKINSDSNFEEEYECWKCGAKIKYYDEPNERVFCPKCRLEHAKEVNKLLKEQATLKSKIMLENAMVIIENSNSFANEYKSSYDYIKKDIEDNPTKYKSSEEIVVAIVLNEFNYDFKANFKIGKYITDFYIPELKVCLEVDGERHKYNTEYDKNRDIIIREKLGADWEIIRIPTKYIEMNPDKIPDAIVNMKKEIQKLRQKYGIIPDNFSNREKDFYNNILDDKKTKKYKENDNYNMIKKYFEEKKQKDI